MRTLYKKCPLCESKEFKDFQVGDTALNGEYNQKLPNIIVWKHCLNCEHVFTEGYFEGEAEKILFSETQDCQVVGFETERERFIAAKMIDKVLPYAADGIWLDVGFGNGNLLLTADEYGFRPIGLDLREDNVKLIESCGIEAYCTDLLNVDFNAGVISMCDVLEHMPYPKQALKHAHTILKNTGVLFISCPNMDSSIWKLTPLKANPYWREIEHYHNFTRVRLYSLLKEVGFTVVKYGVSERYKMCMEIIAIK